jgi:mannan endo-1,4-beta-mannosidase
VDEYITLWRFTVQYLRDEKGLHNLLYCYSPDVFRDKVHYLERYPGDEYVDILALDDYHDLGAEGKTEDLLRRLRAVVELAEERGKISALSETGFEAIPNPTWWTEKLLNPIKNDSVASRISWLMVWRNARPTHHYGPYPGHVSTPNFIQFSKDPVLLFQAQLPKLYRLP